MQKFPNAHFLPITGALSSNFLKLGSIARGIERTSFSLIGRLTESRVTKV
jgi:hypothetical protein